MSVEERARLIIDPDTEKAVRALLAVIDTEKKVGDEAKSVANKREQIEAEFSKKAFDLSHNRVEILKKEFSESLAEAERYGAKRESIEKYYDKAINDARADALAAQGQKLASVGGVLTLGVTAPLIAAGAAGLKFAASMESSAIKYGVLLGDMGKGIPFTEELKKLAAQTPLAFQGLDQAAQTLLGFQVSSDGLTDTLRMLGDLSKGNSEKLQGVALAYGQMSAAGRANMQDLNQLINAGVPILGALATSMGKPVPEIRKMVEEGKVGFSDVDKALKGLVGEGGLFYDMMKKVAETAEGKLSTALDSLKDAAGSAMESLIPLAKDLLDGVTGAAEKFSALDENSRRAILTILGMAAAAGPIMTATGGVMQLVAAYQKLDKAALVAKLTMLASNPVGWAIAGAAAIAGGVALINKAERDHEKALRDKAGAYQETAAAGAALATEYQTLHDKAKLSADEQGRLDEISKALREKYPGLTQDTLDLAAANKILAGEVGKAGEAQGKQNLEAFIAAKNKDLLAAMRGLTDSELRANGLKNNPLQKEYYDRAVADAEFYKTKILAIEKEMQEARDEFYFPKKTSSTPDVTDPPGGSTGTTTVKQGDRLAALDKEYEARVALAKKLGEDVYSVEGDWAKKKYDMLQGFVLEDVKNGKTVEESLLSSLSSGYGTLGELIAAAYKKALAAGNEYTESEKRRISEQQVASDALKADADKIQGLWTQTAAATKLADAETLKFIEAQLAAAKASDENGDAVFKLTQILEMLKAKNEELTESEKRRISEQQVASDALKADADKIQGLWTQTAASTKLADAETLKFIEAQLAAAKASDENGDAVFKLTQILEMLKAKNEELTESEKRRISEQQVASDALKADADKIQGLWTQTAAATKLADAETLKFIEAQLAAAKASDENGDAVFKLTQILEMLKAKNEELTESEKRRISEQQVASDALKADADKIQGLWTQTAASTKLADAETLKFIEAQLAAAKASDENGDAVFKLTQILEMLKAKNEELTESEKRRISEQQVASDALKADADKIQGLWTQTAASTKLADAETLKFIEAQLAAAKASDENGDAVFKLTQILEMLKAKNEELTESEKRRISEQQVASDALKADADKIQGLWTQTAASTKLADAETLKFIEAQLAAAKASDENGDAVFKLTQILEMLKAKNEELTESEKRRISEQQVASDALKADADKIQGLWTQTAAATKLADAETLKFIEAQLAAAKASDENGDAVFKLTQILEMLKAKNEELTESEKRRISEQQVASDALKADADKIQGLWTQTAASTKLADAETLKFIEAQLAAAKASDENGDAVFKLTQILEMLKAKNEELTESEKRRISEQQVASDALKADADKIQGLWTQTAASTKLADAETLKFIEAQLAAAKASDENGDAVFKLTQILEMLKAKNEELTESEKRRISEQQVASDALKADADKIQGLWTQTAAATKLADAETLKFIEAQLAAAKASDENGDAVFKLTAILGMLKEKSKIDLSSAFGDIGGQTGKILSAFATLSNGLETKFKITLISDPAKEKLKAFVKDNKEGLQELAAAGERLLGEMFQSIKDNAASALKEELAGIDDRIESYDKSSARQLDLLRKNGADTVAFELQMNAKKERLDKEKVAKEYAIGKKEFEIEKSSKLAEIAIATALGIAKAWANPITAPWVSALIGGMGIAQAAIVAGQQYPAAYEGAYAPGSSMGALVRIGERHQEEVVLPLRKSKLEELGLSGSSAGNIYIERVQVVLPEGTSRDQALAMLDAFKGLKREGLLKGLVA